MPKAAKPYSIYLRGTITIVGSSYSLILALLQGWAEHCLRKRITFTVLAVSREYGNLLKGLGLRWPCRKVLGKT